MLKLKTKTEFQVPNDRGFVSTVVRIIVESLTINKNHIKAEGYYYYYDVNNNIVIPSNGRFGASSLIPKETLAYLETNVFGNFNNPKGFYLAIEQRLFEMTMIQLSQESGQNYGTVASDFEIDNDEIIQNPIM